MINIHIYFMRDIYYVQTLIVQHLKDDGLI
jgi:hypothetical protein